MIIDLGDQDDGFTITGSAHADTITGSSGADEINAGDEADTIVGFVGADTVDGGDGDDTLTLAGTSADLNAAGNGDLVNVETVSAAGAGAGVIIDLGDQGDGFTITGSAHADTITGSSGADADRCRRRGRHHRRLCRGRHGRRRGRRRHADPGWDLRRPQCAGNGDLVNVETVSAAGAGAGVTIDLGDQDDGFTITGSAHADTITGSSGADEIDAGDEADTIVGFVGADTVDGGDGDDTLTLAGTSADLNAAGNGDLVDVETVSAAGAGAGVIIDLGDQDDGFTITGSAHADTITGSSGADQIDAGDEADTIVGFVGADTVDGGDGDDTLTLAGTSADLNAAGNGDLANVETVSAAGAGAGVIIDLGDQNDGFTLTGSAHADTITGSSGADQIDAGDEADTIVGFVGADTVDGGDGDDTLTLSGTSADLNAAGNGDLANVETVSAAGAGAGVIIDLGDQDDGFTITGSAHADTITGSSGADQIDAGDEADTMSASSGRHGRRRGRRRHADPGWDLRRPQRRGQRRPRRCRDGVGGGGRGRGDHRPRRPGRRLHHHRQRPCRHHHRLVGGRPDRCRSRRGHDHGR